MMRKGFNDDVDTMQLRLLQATEDGQNILQMEIAKLIKEFGKAMMFSSTEPEVYNRRFKNLIKNNGAGILKLVAGSLVILGDLTEEASKAEKKTARQDDAKSFEAKIMDLFGKEAAGIVEAANGPIAYKPENLLQHVLQSVGETPSTEKNQVLLSDLNELRVDLEDPDTADLAINKVSDMLSDDQSSLGRASYQWAVQAQAITGVCV